MTQHSIRRVIVVGGAGFIGGHFVDRLLAEAATTAVTVYDNFSSGRLWHLAAHQADDRLNVITADVRDLEALVTAAAGHDTEKIIASPPVFSDPVPGTSIALLQVPFCSVAASAWLRPWLSI